MKPEDALRRGQQTLANDLKQACQELLAYQKTGILESGVVRSAAQWYTLVTGNYAQGQKMAEDVTHRLAMKFVTKHKDKEKP